MNASRSTRAGFSLIEMVIVIGILGVLLGFYFMVQLPTEVARANAETKEKMNRILNVAASYALLQNSLPCAADPRDDRVANGRDFGRCNTNQSRGVVPFRNLGLSADDVKDGFGRYMTYIVHGNYFTPPGSNAENSATSRFCGLGGGLNVNRNGVNETSNAAIVLISHGADGIGGYNISDLTADDRIQAIGQKAGTLGVLGVRERNNSADIGSTDTNIEDISTQQGNNHFDDVVMYATGRGLVSRLMVTSCQ